jgi:hypothetical protein
MELESANMEQSDDDLTDSSDREDSDARKTRSHWPNDPSEIKCRCYAYIAHEQEILAEKLYELDLEVETSPENVIVEKLKRCFNCVDDIFEYANQFFNQALLVEMRNFTGFYFEMHEDASQSIRQALTIVSKLRRGNLFFLVPLVKDLVTELIDIKVLVSRTNLEQVKETLESYNSRWMRTLREIEKL